MDANAPGRNDARLNVGRTIVTSGAPVASAVFGLLCSRIIKSLYARPVSDDESEPAKYDGADRGLVSRTSAARPGARARIERNRRVSLVGGGAGHSRVPCAHAAAERLFDSGARPSAAQASQARKALQDSADSLERTGPLSGGAISR